MDEVRIQAIVQQIKFRIIKLKNIKRNEMHINDTLCAANPFSSCKQCFKIRIYILKHSIHKLK